MAYYPDGDKSFRAIELDPQLAEAWYNKSIAIKALGRTTEAMLPSPKQKSWCIADRVWSYQLFSRMASWHEGDKVQNVHRLSLQEAEGEIMASLLVSSGCAY